MSQPGDRGRGPWLAEPWPPPGRLPVTARAQRDQKVGRPVLALVLLAVVLVALVGLIADEVGGAGLVVGGVLALLPVLVVVRSYLWLDRWEPEPPHLLRVAFFWGMSGAALIAVTLNSAAVAGAADVIGSADAEALGAVVVAPVVEEAAKGVVLIWALTRHRREIDGVLDGLVLAGFVGVGFAFTENVLYFGRAFVMGIDESGIVGGFLTTTATFVMRGVLAPFAHPFFTSMLGIAVGVAATTRSRGLGVVALLVGFTAAVLLHALWNGAAVMAGEAFASFYLVVMVPLFLTAVLVAAWSRRREGRIVARHLPAYAAAGWIAASEVGLLARQSARRQLLADAARVGGPAAVAGTREYHAIATELCFLRERLARGRAGPDGQHRQGELLLALARARQSALLHPLPVAPAPTPSGWSW